MYTTDDSSTSIQSVDTTTHREEIELKKRLADEKIKESKLECIKEEDEIEPSGVEKKISKLMSYDWTFLDLVILIYSALSILSFSRCFIACMLLLPTDEGLFYAFSGLYWFVTIYPTYKFFTNLNVRGAVMVHLYVNIISGGSLVFIVGLTFINSRYIAQRYYSYYIILLFDAFMQFMSIIVLSFVPFKVIRTRSIFKVSNDYSIKIGNGLADATVKVYNSTKKSIEELMNNKKEETPASKTVIKLDSKHSDTITSNKYGSPTKRL
uniref:Scamp family-domain-containing protein n=1 Tax=Parastrongyloides trichosuri TaxID=131310 RepID=A0A0N4ZQ02_PARTI